MAAESISADLPPGELPTTRLRRRISRMILDRFLHHAKVLSINGKSYRLMNQACKDKAGK